VLVLICRHSSLCLCSFSRLNKLFNCFRLPPRGRCRVCLEKTRSFPQSRKAIQANVTVEAISSDLTRFNRHDVVVPAAQVGLALAALGNVCCQPIIPGWLDRLLPEFLTGWRSLPYWRMLMSSCWRTMACRRRSGRTLSSQVGTLRVSFPRNSMPLINTRVIACAGSAGSAISARCGAGCLDRDTRSVSYRRVSPGHDSPGDF